MDKKAQITQTLKEAGFDRVEFEEASDSEIFLHGDVTRILAYRQHEGREQLVKALANLNRLSAGAVAAEIISTWNKEVA